MIWTNNRINGHWKKLNLKSFYIVRSKVLSSSGANEIIIIIIIIIKTKPETTTQKEQREKESEDESQKNKKKSAEKSPHPATLSLCLSFSCVCVCARSMHLLCENCDQSSNFIETILAVK
jgi:hypothetical protein